MLQNGNFDGATWRKCFDGGEYSEIDLPKPWVCFWDKNGKGENGQENAKPEVKVIGKIPPYLDPMRIAEGNYAMELFTFQKPHRAGIYQKVEGLTEGVTYRVTAQYHAWCSQGDNPHVSDQADSYGMYAQIGVDKSGWVNQYGYVDPAYDNKNRFEWSQEFYVFDDYKEISFEFTATTDMATIALMTVSKWGSKHGNAYWDNVTLEAVDGSDPGNCNGNGNGDPGNSPPVLEGEYEVQVSGSLTLTVTKKE